MEIRIFLEHGRLAWSTSTSSKHTFTSYLTEHLGVDRSTIETAIHACRQKHCPFDEYLVAHEILSSDQMSEALQHQIASALAELEILESSGQSFFLQRNETISPHRITFSVWDVLELSGESQTIDGSELVRQDIEALQFYVDQLDAIPGYLGSVVVNRGHGLVLNVHGRVSFSLARMANEFFQVFQAETEALRILQLESQFEEMVTTLCKQFHLTCILGQSRELLMHAAFGKGAKLALLRVKLRQWIDEVATHASR